VAVLSVAFAGGARGDYFIWPPLEDEWGVETNSSIGGTPYQIDENGGKHWTEVSSEVSDPRAAGSSHGELGMTPVFTASGQTTADGGVAHCYNRVIGIEAYTWEGEGLPTDLHPLTIQASLSGSIDFGDGDAYISAFITVVDSSGFEFYADWPTLAGEFGVIQKSEWNGYPVVNPPPAEIELGIDSYGAVLDGNTTFRVNPGETVYVYTELHANVEGANAIADCSNTLTFHFEDTTDLVAGSTTGEEVPLGDPSGSANGGAGNTGGVNYAFQGVTTGGTLFVGATVTDPGEDIQWGYNDVDEPEPELLDLNTILEVWDVEFDGEFDTVTLTFWYDEALLPPGVQEEDLQLWHFDGDVWEWELLDAQIDTALDTITVTMDSLSPFLMTPEPASLSLLVLGAAVVLLRRRRI